MPPKRKTRKSKGRRKKKSGGKVSQPAALSRPCTPSAALKELLGLSGSVTVGRSQALKLVWARAKAKGLNQGRAIRCDRAMQRVFGDRETVGMFEIPGLLASHLTSSSASSDRSAAVVETASVLPGAALRSSAAVTLSTPPLIGPVILSGRLTSLLCGGFLPGSDDSRQLTLPSEAAVVSKVKAYVMAKGLRQPRSNIILCDPVRSL